MLQQEGDMHRPLCDSNETLLSVGNVTLTEIRLFPTDETLPWRLRSVQQSSPNNRSASEARSEAVDSSGSEFLHAGNWAKDSLDSGSTVSLAMTDGSSSEYDSEDSQESVGTISEAAVSVAPSKCSSIASSIRRRLSVFSSKVDTDTLGSEAPAPTYRLVLAGDTGSGKSSFLLRLSTNTFRKNIQSTLGVDFLIKKMLVDGEKTTLQFWDTAGQERFRSVARSYFRKAHGVLLLYDVTSERSFLNVRQWMDQIQESTHECLPTCIIGNKTDLRAESPEDICVTTADGEKLAKVYSALFCETSAKDGIGVIEAVLHLAREVKMFAQQQQKSKPQSSLSLSLRDEKKKALSNCCEV
ncbi:hypothetical protein MATL_G00093860 [Megalops atlanticus]|uniref:Uncharacterized protein n=1 Tax=Megalops atlanticus TaxID=7932 RepID=A0A9D3Q5N2_MEGAT|nr:hypothetical protein MATL_G00093860 [Megalops atlanticus]